MILEGFIQAVIYATTAIASLRAGSRAMYAYNHGHEIGVMDGPLILSPRDIALLREQGSMEGEVSPLWESVHAFTESVRLLRDENNLADDVVVVNWKKEEETKYFYSMSTPHKSVDEKVIEEKVDKDSTTSNTTRSADEKSLVVVEPKEINKWRNPKAFSLLQKYVSSRVHDFYEASKTIKSLCLEVWDCHPLFGSNQLFSRAYDEKDDDDEDDKEDTGEEDDLDLDLFYTKTIQMPKDKDADDLITGKESLDSDKEIDRVARIKAYAPKTFTKLRTRFGISEEQFISSLTKSGPNISFQSNSKGAARVGGFFFFTRDGAFMVKTIKKAEIKAILEMLPKYYKFMKSNARRSLLTRFCGLYSIKLGYAGDSRKEEDEKCFLIMNSVFPAEASQFISERFDLKGSTVGRECSEEEKESKGSHAVLKDLDLLKEVEAMRSVSAAFKIPDCGICIGPTAKAALLSQLRKDLSLLVDCAVMDYSLLVGVVNMDSSDGAFKSNLVKSEIETILRSSKKKKRRNQVLSAFYEPIENMKAPVVTVCKIAYNGIQSTLSTVLTRPLPYYGAGQCGVDGGALSILGGRRLGKRAIYYMGIIDFLQPWTTQKVLENQLKGALGYNKSAISCVDPKEYAERFLKFMDKVIT